MVRVILIRNRILFYISTIIFIISILLGTLFTIDNKMGKNIESPGSMINLFLNNLEASLFIASGLFIFGISSVLFLSINGFVVGGTIKSCLIKGFPISEILLKLVPHGIFEVPALLLAGTIGFRGVYLLIAIYMPRRSLQKEISNLFLDICLLGVITFILLFIAALIEWYITP